MLPTKIKLLFILLTLALCSCIQTVKIHQNHLTSPNSGRAISSKNLNGPEDITIDQEAGLAYVSCRDLLNRVKSGTPKGRIFEYNLKTSKIKEMPILKSDGSQFQKLDEFNRYEKNALQFHPDNIEPHGVSLYRSDDQSLKLFVINHETIDGEPRDFVEIFKIESGTLYHLRRVSDLDSEGNNRINTLNDIQAVGEESFYATEPNMSIWSLLTGWLWEAKNGNVVYYDGSDGKDQYQRVIQGLAYPNGIAINAEGTQIYVSTIFSESVFEFIRNPHTGQIAPSPKSYRLGFPLDNMNWQDSKWLLVGGHPSFYKMGRHVKNGSQAPSTIIRFKVHPNGSIDANTFEEIFYDDGTLISGSSVGAIWKDRLLVGSVNDAKFLDIKTEGKGTN